ncbi:MAG: hypothetical protein ACLSAH_07655 [Bilophila wadsworthia]
MPWEARLTGGAIRREPRRGRPQRGAHKNGCRAERGAAITGCGNNTDPCAETDGGERQVPERIAFLMTGRHIFTPEDGAFPAAAYPFPNSMLTSSQKVFDVLEFLCANGPHKALEARPCLCKELGAPLSQQPHRVRHVRKDDQTGFFGDVRWCSSAPW